MIIQLQLPQECSKPEAKGNPFASCASELRKKSCPLTATSERMTWRPEQPLKPPRFWDCNSPAQERVRPSLDVTGEPDTKLEEGMAGGRIIFG